MNKRLVLLVLCLLLPGCGLKTVRGSGQLVARDYALSGFTRVEASHGFQVTLQQGEGYQVSVSVDDNLLDALQVVAEGDTLRIGLKPGTYYDTTARAIVVLPQLDSLKLTGSAKAILTGFRSSSSCQFTLSGFSTADGAVECGHAEFILSSKSTLRLVGSATDLVLQATGSGEVDLSGFLVGPASITVAGGSEATVNASGPLDVDLSEGAVLSYVGQPAFGQKKISSGATLRPK
jgi:hypothetical protein